MLDNGLLSVHVPSPYRDGHDGQTHSALARYTILMATRISDATREKIAAAWPALIDAVATGGNIGDACALAGITRDQCRVYRLGNPDAAAEWEQARLDSADTFAEQVQTIVNSPMPDSQVARVRIDALRWLAAKRNPRYNDRVDMSHTVKHVDLTAIILAANQRIAARNARVLEGEYARLPDNLS